MKKQPPPYLSYSHYANDALAASNSTTPLSPAPFLAPAMPPSNYWFLAIVSRQFRVFA
jgi:hypothetical protein